MAEKIPHIEQEAAEGTPEDAKAPDGLLVLVDYTDGNANVSIQLMGTTRATEIDTLLRVARKTASNQLNLD